jgi:uncharacterized RDD family membrane protein YckC
MTNQPGGSYPPPPPPHGSSGGYQPPPPPGSGGFPPPPGSSAPPPPPVQGGYPPPPPSAGGYAPPPPGPAIRELPTDSYTPWLTRVLAFLIDYAPVLVVYGIAFVISMVTQHESCVTSPYSGMPAYCYQEESTIGVLVNWLAYLAIAAYVVWNYGYKQGTTGSSIGKSIMKFKVVSETTGEPLGFGMSLVRQIAHFVDAIICYVGFLFPLWDKKRQTLADKIMTTVCLPL